MTTAIAVHPLFLTCSIFGVGVYNQKKQYLSLCCILIMWIMYGYLFYYTVILFKAEVFYTRFSLINVVLSVCSCVTSVILSAFQNKRFQIFMKRLAAVDHTLTKLGISNIKCHKMHTYIKRIIIIWIICIIISNGCDTVWWIYALGNPWVFFLAFIVNHVHHVSIIVDLLFLIFLWYIGIKFDNINELINCLVIKEERGELRCTWRKTIPANYRYIMCTDNYTHIVWTSMHLHLEVSRIARELNAMFGIQMILEMIGYLIFLSTLFTYFFTYLLTKGLYVVTSFNYVNLQCWVILYIARVVCFNYFCEIVKAKANNIDKIIHKFTYSLRYSEIRNEIHQFTLQLIHHPLNFTGLGLFNFGYSFLRNFFTRMITFVMLAVQWRVLALTKHTE